MVTEYKQYKPIKIFGFFLLAFGLVGFAELILELNNPELKSGYLVFLLTMSIWHSATGFGIFFRKKWGYPALKIYLYILLLGIPLGTLLAIRILRYIKENKIELFFKEQELLI